MKRVCQIIRVKPERFDEYCQVRRYSPAQRVEARPPARAESCTGVQVHAEVWPSVLAALEKVCTMFDDCALRSDRTAFGQAHFVDYSIHHDPIHSLLIGHFTYTGVCISRASSHSLTMAVQAPTGMETWRQSLKMKRLDGGGSLCAVPTLFPRALQLTLAS